MKLRDMYLIYLILLCAVVFVMPYYIIHYFMPNVRIDFNSAWSYFNVIWAMPLVKIQSHYIATTGEYTTFNHLGVWLLRMLPVMAGGGGAIALIKSYSQKQQNMQDVRVSATWASMGDISEYLGKDGVLLTKGIRLHEEECYEHVMVVGPTGSGKTASYFLPNILKLLPHQSTVIFDPKGEIYQNTSQFHISQGRDVQLLKLDDHTVSACWNPLDVPKDMVQMSKVCKSVIKNKSGDGGGGGGGDQDMWDASAEDLLIALIYASKALIPGTFGNFRNIYHLLANLTFEAMIGLAYYAVADTDAKIEAGELEPDKDIKDLISRTKSFSSKVAPEDTRNSTRFVLKTALSAFQIDTVAFITSTSTMRFECLKERPTALFISMPEHKVDGVKGVMATMYMQLFDSILDFASVGSDAAPEIKKRPIFFFLDEFANCGKILGFTNYIATIRSRQMSVSVCLQSPAQLKQSYTDDEAQAIKNNLKTVLILPGLKEDSSLKYFSDISGKAAYMDRDNMNSESMVKEKDKLPMAAIRELVDDRQKGIHEAIVIFKNKPPIKDLQKRYYQDPELLNILKNNPPRAFQKNPPNMFDDVRKRNYLEPGDLDLCEMIGTFINYHGKLDGLPEQYKLDIVQKYSEFSDIAGLPTFCDKGGKLQLTWPKAKDARGRICQVMVTTAFQWMYKEKLYKL